MPLWTIYHTPNVFSDKEKSELAKSITEVYVAVGLPRFYVVTVFKEIEPVDLYVGGEQADTAVRVVVDHIARTQPDKAARERVTRRLGNVLRPYLDRPGLHWEFHVDETSEDLWIINGQVPPPMHSDAEREWAQTNRSSPYTAAV